MTLHAARNALVVFVAAMLGYCLKLQPWFKQQISLIDYDNGKLPSIQVPDPTSDVCSVSILYMIVQLLSTDRVVPFIFSGAWYRYYYGATDQLLGEYCNSQSIW